MYNYAREWAGAFYSWACNSIVDRCIFINNTAGTNGGAVMVSGNINLQDSIIVNNDGGETGGSFYIQQPMYNKKTVINVHDNLITNNTSPLGKEIFISWKDTDNLYTQFDNNDWGDEDPNDSSVIDPNNVTSRSKVSKTIRSDLFGRLNLNLLDKYSDLLKDYFPDDSLESLKDQFYTLESGEPKKQDSNHVPNSLVKTTNDTENKNSKSDKNSELANTVSNNQIFGNSTSYGDNDKAYELNKTGGSAAKQANLDITKFIAITAIVFILLAIGYRRQKRVNS